MGKSPEALFSLVPAPSSELRLLASSASDMGKCWFVGDEILDSTVSAISLEVSVGFWKGGIRWIAHSMAFLTIPLLSV